MTQHARRRPRQDRGDRGGHHHASPRPPVLASGGFAPCAGASLMATVGTSASRPELELPHEMWTRYSTLRAVTVFLAALLFCVISLQVRRPAGLTSQSLQTVHFAISLGCLLKQVITPARPNTRSRLGILYFRV
ncbi:unnamed protein product [Prorocentrum cordatum]|uniref:Uncharacterized protein n=1 Tax=Prorocentrum cordatum TaxID=2364126 RepID=A0ABN9ULA1_9DINO|nr:unnamed protein product [Polarella glacialis]